MVINNNMKLLCRKRFIIKICYNTQLLLFKWTFCMEPKWYLLQTNDPPHMVPVSHAVLLNDACNFFCFWDFLKFNCCPLYCMWVQAMRKLPIKRECHTCLHVQGARLPGSPRLAKEHKFCRLGSGNEPGEGNGPLWSGIKVNKNWAHYLGFKSL